ncbi:MAG: Crp/Fnr family transcriptional regulator [Bacteroidota bacterium]
MPDPTLALTEAVRRWAPLDADRLGALAGLFVPREVEARTPVALPGDDRHEILFVASGLLRFYYPADDGRESNKAFVVEDEFAAALAAARLGVPILYGVEALEPTTLLAARIADLDALMEAEPSVERFGRRLAEYLLTRKAKRTRSLLTQSATERYLALVEARPDLVQRVPLYHLASYLGVTDVHLSRIRRETAVAI